MAYESKVTNKYFGTTFAGAGKATVQTDGLVEALKTVTPKLKEIGSSYIESKQKEAEAELASLQASGKSLEDIQKIITSGENEQLNSMYATATNDMWMGKTQAAKDWQSVLANQDNYDPKSQSAEEFLNEHVTADFDKGGKYFSGAYASVWNEKKASFLLSDAENRFKTRNTEELNSMSEFIKTYNGVENGLSIYDRLKTKINSDGKPPTNSQINAAVLQSVEQLVEVGEYNKAEDFLKTHRGYNGKMEVKSLLDSGNPTAYDLMAKIIAGRNAKTVADAKAKKEANTLRFGVLNSMYVTGETIDGVELGGEILTGGQPLNEEQKLLIAKELTNPTHIGSFNKVKVAFSGAPDVFNNRQILNGYKQKIANGNYFGIEDGYNQFLNDIISQGVKLNPMEARELQKFFTTANEAYKKNVDVTRLPQVTTMVDKLSEIVVTNSKIEKKGQAQRRVFSVIEQAIHQQLRTWLTEDVANFPPSEMASNEIKIAYEQKLQSKLQEIETQVMNRFGTNAEIKAITQFMDTPFDMNPDETKDTLINAISRDVMNVFDRQAGFDTIGKIEEIENIVATSKANGQPIPVILMNSDTFKNSLFKAKGKLDRTDMAIVASKIMENYPELYDNTEEIMERNRNIVDRMSTLNKEDVTTEEDLGLIQQVIDAFTDEDEVRQAQRVKEALEAVIGEEISGRYLLGSLKDEALEAAATQFNLSLKEFKDVLKRIR